MKTSIEKFYTFASEYSMTQGENIYKSKKLLICSLTPCMIAGKVTYYSTSFYDDDYEIYFKIKFDDDGDIISCATSVNSKNKDFNIAHIVAALKLREAYINNDNTYYQINSLVDDSECYDFSYFDYQSDVEFTYIPYSEKDYDKNFKKELISLNKNNKNYSSKICNLIRNYLDHDYCPNLKIKTIFTIAFDLIKEENNIQLLIEVLNSLKKDIEIQVFFEFLLQKLNDQDDFVTLFFLNIPATVSSKAYKYIKNLLYSYPMYNSNFNEEFLLSIFKDCDESNLNYEIIKTAVSLEYLEIIKYILKNDSNDLNILYISKVIDIIKRKVDSSQYFSIFEKRIRYGKLYPEEYRFLYPYLNKEQIRLMNDNVNKGKDRYWICDDYISKNFINYFDNKALFKVQDLYLSEFYALRHELLNQNNEYYEKSIKAFKILANKELCKRSYYGNYLELILTIIQENIDKKEIVEYLTCERTINYLDKNKDKDFVCIFRNFILSSGLLNEIHGYKKF